MNGKRLIGKFGAPKTVRILIDCYGACETCKLGAHRKAIVIRYLQTYIFGGVRNSTCELTFPSLAFPNLCGAKVAHLELRPNGSCIAVRSSGRRKLRHTHMSLHLRKYSPFRSTACMIVLGAASTQEKDHAQALPGHPLNRRSRHRNRRRKSQPQIPADQVPRGLAGAHLPIQKLLYELSTSGVAPCLS